MLLSLAARHLSLNPMHDFSRTSEVLRFPPPPHEAAHLSSRECPLMDLVSFTRNMGCHSDRDTSS